MQYICAYAYVQYKHISSRYIGSANLYLTHQYHDSDSHSSTLLLASTEYVCISEYVYVSIMYDILSKAPQRKFTNC